MADTAPLPGQWPVLAQDTPAQTFALAEQLRCIVAIARGLVVRGRCVDLTGLDHSVGLLCARALDLPPAQGKLMRIELLNLVRELDTLTYALGDPPADPARLT